MLGWEFPPINSGGLGVASSLIAKYLAQQNSEIQLDFVIPTFIYDQLKHEHKPKNYRMVKLEAVDNLTVCRIESALNSPYLNQKSYSELYGKIIAGKSGAQKLYGANLLHEIHRFAHEVAQFVRGKNYDLIHAHDWITFEAGLKAKKISGAKMIAHVHATEIDRTAGNFNPEIFAIEKNGLEKSDHIVSVSDHTKQILESHYEIPSEKITAVHNGIDELKPEKNFNLEEKDKLVLFLGRVTVQKGPDYFLEVAKKVVEQDPNIKFVLGGEGDMLPLILSRIIAYGLSNNVFCAGFLNEEQKKQAFKRTALYMMPSVSEPFGLSAIEAINENIPTIICKQSGAAEVIKNAFKADFWDIERMAQQVLATINYPAIGSTMVPNAKRELRRFTWFNQTQKIAQVYRSLLR
jgi:glycosyltransferase involved in cell wall biosynthesis